MTQEDKELLLKDLCARLPYGVKMNHIANNDNEPITLIGVAKDMITLEGNGGYSTENVEEFKPYLFPISNMTNRQKEDHRFLTSYTKFHTAGLIDFYNKHHIDYRGLIPKGLALDATGLNIY